MKFSHPIPIKIIAEFIHAEILGDANQLATGINEIHKAGPGDIMFVDVEKYFKKALDSAATIIILHKNIECPNGKTLLLTDNPFESYNSLALKYCPAEYIKKQISDSTRIDPTSFIEPGAIIGNHVHIGAHSYIQAGAIIRDHCHIGNHVIIQSGAILGTSAFYFKKHETHYEKWHSIGRVVIEDYVDIGAGSTINRGVSGDTIIGEGTKIDSQVHIGHGVVIGKRCLLAAQVGIAGKTVVGDDVTMYGQVGVAQNLTIGNNVIILAKSGVHTSLESNKQYFGSPVGEMRQKYKEIAALKQLPDIIKRNK